MSVAFVASAVRIGLSYSLVCLLAFAGWWLTLLSCLRVLFFLLLLLLLLRCPADDVIARPFLVLHARVQGGYWQLLLNVVAMAFARRVRVVSSALVHCIA